MVLTLKKIQHRRAYRIGISFPYSVEVNQKLKSLGAVYSSTLHCWYLDDHAANYQLLQSNFDELVIENPKQEHAKTVQVAGPQSRNLPPIVAQPMPAATKLPEKTGEKPIKGHKAENSTLAQKLNLQLFENIGKYRVFSMNCFAMSGYSVPQGCYLLPAAPGVYKALAVHYGPEKMALKNLLQKGYLKKENMPDRKQFLLQKAKNQVLENVPGTARRFVVSMMENGKGKKDRMVMLPYSVLAMLENYRVLYPGKDYIFEGQFAGAHYSTGSVQKIMAVAMEKSGLAKKGGVHNLSYPNVWISSGTASQRICLKQALISGTFSNCRDIRV